MATKFLEIFGEKRAAEKLEKRIFLGCDSSVGKQYTNKCRDIIYNFNTNPDLLRRVLTGKLSVELQFKPNTS